MAAASKRGGRSAPRAPKPPIDTVDRRAQPYEMIKKAILRGEFEPGQPLVETALAAWCEVSRTPIREALTRLEQDGLVVRSDRGLVVRERSPEEIMDVYETRIVLEATVGRVAAERRTAHDIRSLRRLLALCEGIEPSDPRSTVTANRQFHRALWRASHNESLLDLLERLNLHLGRYPETTLSYPGRWAHACQEHAEIVDAVEDRDGDRAYELSLKHFTEARDIRLTLFDRDDAF
jgi:DNA-binding GntR family transcriptional regulator